VLLKFHYEFHRSFVNGLRVDVVFTFPKRVYKLMLQVHRQQRRRQLLRPAKIAALSSLS
jgi:hypothetical protein